MTFHSGKELKDWIKLTKLVEFDSEFDSCGNEESYEIRSFEGKFYRLESLNGGYYCDWTKVKPTEPMKRIPNQFTPKQVKRIERTVIDWEYIESNLDK